MEPIADVWGPLAANGGKWQLITDLWGPMVDHWRLLNGIKGSMADYWRTSGRFIGRRLVVNSGILAALGGVLVAIGVPLGADGGLLAAANS